MSIPMKWETEQFSEWNAIALFPVSIWRVWKIFSKWRSSEQHQIARRTDELEKCCTESFRRHRRWPPMPHRSLSRAHATLMHWRKTRKMWNCATLFGANIVSVCASSLFDSHYFTVYSVLPSNDHDISDFQCFSVLHKHTRHTVASNEGFFGPCRIYDVNGIGVHTSRQCVCVAAKSAAQSSQHNVSTLEGYAAWCMPQCIFYYMETL